MAEQWYEKRFTESAAKVHCSCTQCGRSMWFPPSKAGKYATCGPACAAERRGASVKARERNCLTCGSIFSPRASQVADGGGKYCCVACAEPTREAGRTAAAAERRTIVMRQLRAQGKVRILRGAESPSWKGGPLAQKERQRLKDPEIRRARRRAYVAANRERVREWTKKRRASMTGRLPRGTVQKLGRLQRWRCAACSVDIRKTYHLDHVQPLAGGGEHNPGNLQLLCPTCNVRKGARDPVVFMQSLGFLL